MKVEFETKITEQDLYKFNIYQTYTHSQGIVSIVLGILCWIMAGISFSGGETLYGFLYIACGFMFIIYMPVSLKMRVKKTYSTSDTFSQPLHFEATESSIVIKQGQESGELLWEQVYRLVSNDKWILVFTGRMNAYIIPREQIGDKYEPFIELARKKLEHDRLKIK